MFKSELFQWLFAEYIKYSFENPEEEEVAGNTKDLLENIHERFSFFINESGVFLSSYIISNSEAKDRKTLLKELLNEHSAKANHL